MKHIYVITCGSSFVKVGVASNISKRLKALQTGAPLPLKLFDSVRVESAQLAYRYEYLVHRKLARFATTGEWFRIAPAEAMAVLTSVIAGPPKNTNAELEREAARVFRNLLTCPHCNHKAFTRLANKAIFAGRFRCTGCNRSVEGRRFFIR